MYSHYTFVLLQADLSSSQSHQSDPTQMLELQIAYEAEVNSQESCPSCIASKPDNYTKEMAGWPLTRIELSGGTRLVDACMNMMSEEHTCYPSDHALSRCLIHGAYAAVIDVDCWGVNIQTSVGDETIGFCMGIDECKYSTQFTCHRWMADPSDYRNPIPNAWTENDEE